MVSAVAQTGFNQTRTQVSALKKMAPPTSKQELQAFLGLATYMGLFIHNLSTLTSPLRELVKDRNIFDWSSVHQDAFGKIKGYYDPTKEVVLQAGASTRGLGATLLQD